MKYLLKNITLIWSVYSCQYFRSDINRDLSLIGAISQDRARNTRRKFSYFSSYITSISKIVSLWIIGINIGEINFLTSFSQNTFLFHTFFCI